MSLVIVGVVVLWMYLTYQGTATSSIWLCMNLIDSARALRTIRPNGRRIGQATRRKAMKEALTCWAVFVLVQFAGAIPDKLLGWLPFYPIVRGVIAIGFLSTRASSSASIHKSLVVPILKQYEKPIDLTLSLFHGISVLLSYYVIVIPLKTVVRAGRALYSVAPGRHLLQRLQQSSKHIKLEEDPTTAALPTALDTESIRVSVDPSTTPDRVIEAETNSLDAPISPTMSQPPRTPAAYPSIPRPVTPPPQPFVEIRTVRRSTRRRAPTREPTPPSPESPHATIHVAPPSATRLPPPASRRMEVPSRRSSVSYPQIKPLLPPSTSSRPVLADRANKRKVATLGGSLEKHTKAGRVVNTGGSAGLGSSTLPSVKAAAVSKAAITKTRSSHQPLERPARRLAKIVPEESAIVGEKRKAPAAVSVAGPSAVRRPRAKLAVPPEAEGVARKRRRQGEAE